MKGKTIIGKDVLESLTTSMYDDARFVYREYIQNSADAIDKARLQKFVEEGNIYITINADKRRIEIEDDAIGVEVVNVYKYLKDIAVSHKRKGVDKGFRGIGRLGGLGYCDKLIFETSAQGESVKSLMIWDAKKLKEIIADRTQKEEASTVIDEVTTFKQENEIADKHYFKVILENVTNDILLDVKDIRQYLSMVAPVPFKKSIFSDKIYDKLIKENMKIDEYNTFVNTEQLFKGYNWYIYEGDQNNKRKIGEIFEIEFFSEKNRNGEKLFWGWYGIAEKNEALNKINYSRGFRLRKANIQIGNDDTLQKLQKENRFQFYFFGEVYALHPDLQPNARRDYFSENKICKEFDFKLKEFFYKTIAPLCQDSSTTNASIKKIEIYNNLLAEYQHKEEKGFINKDEKANLESEIEKKKKDAEIATKKIENLKSKENSPISKIIEKRTSNVNIEIKETEIETPPKPTFRTDKLSKLEKRDRKFLGEIFAIINNVLTKDLAENLIQKIEEKYK
jgi:molecular chaperone HtpG